MSRIFDDGTYWYRVVKVKEEEVIYRTMAPDDLTKSPDRKFWSIVKLSRTTISERTIKQLNSFFGVKFRYPEEDSAESQYLVHGNYKYRVLLKDGYKVLQRLYDGRKGEKDKKSEQKSISYQTFEISNYEETWEDVSDESKAYIKIGEDALRRVNRFYKTNFPNPE